MTGLRVAPVHAFDVGLQMLGYRFIPSGAFDSSNNLQMPADFKLPGAWSETVGRVTNSPDWEELLNILGILATPGSAWSCWRVAVNFRQGILRVIVARPGQLSDAGSQVALNWANNSWPRIASLRDYAGRKRLLPAGLTDGVKNVSDQVKGSPYWDKKVPDDKQPAFDLLRWKVFTGLDLIAHVAEFLGSITTKSKVLATVLWYDPKHSSVPAPQLRWAPLHQLYDGFGLRAIHYWWNFNWDTTKPATYPFPSSAVLKRKGFGVTDVAHEPRELAEALYPNSNWAPPPPPPPPPREWVCEEDLNGKQRCRWQPASRLAAEQEPPAGAGDDERMAPFDSPDLSAFERPTRGLLAPGGEGNDGEGVPPLVLAYGLPLEGSAFLGAGTIRDGIWFPLEEDQESITESIALPSLGIVARADGFSQGWRPAGQLPKIETALRTPAAWPSAPRTPPR